MPRRLLSAAAVGALLLGLAACGDADDGPVTTPPPDLGIEAPSDGGGDADPSDGGGETDEPTADAPDIPPPDPADFAGMDENTPEGAEQAFKYYIAVMYWGYQTGASSEIKDLHGPTCSECTTEAETIAQIGENGAYWSATELTARGSTTGKSENFDIEVGYIYIVGEHVEPSITGSDAATVPEQAFTSIGGMDWDNERWVVGGLGIEETQSEL